MDIVKIKKSKNNEIGFISFEFIWRWIIEVIY